MSELDSSDLDVRPTLSKEVLASMWERVTSRLQNGEVLVRNEQFQEVLEDEYRQLTGKAPSSDICRYIEQIIEVVNSQYPGTYVALGLQNGVNRAFDRGVQTLKWNESKIQERGARSIKRFSLSESVRGLLDEVNLRPSQIDILRIVQHSIDMVRTDEVKPAGAAPIFAEAVADQVPVSASVVTPTKPADNVVVDREVQAAIENGEFEAGQVQQRLVQQEQRGTELQAREMAKVPERLEGFVERGTLSNEVASKIRQLHKVDAEEKKGVIDASEASRVRNSIMDGEARDEIESKVRESVVQTTRYLQVFEAMRKIGPDYDDAFEFLIRHKEGVVAESSSDAALGQAVAQLADDTPMLEKIINVMERKDQELRMVSVRLPPYNLVMQRQLEKIGRMTIEPSFLDELRRLGIDDISERLNSEISEIRVRPAADMRCFISLIDHVIKRTVFRKEIRMLRVASTLEQFFRDTTDMAEARHMAENFLNLRMRRLFPDLSSDETSEIRQRGAVMIDTIEQKMLNERRGEIAEKREQAEEVVQTRGAGEERGSEDLTEEEKSRGVMIGRIEMRVAGGRRRVPRKIMPDPEDESKFVIATRDPETGEPVPEMRRNAKRYVERGRGGAWALV